MANDSSYDVTYISGKDQSDSMRTDGELAAMSDRVSRLASALRSKLQYLMEECGREPVQQLIPYVVEALEELNSATSDAKEHVTALRELTNDHEQLLKQYNVEKHKRVDAEKRNMVVEDELNTQINELKDELLSLRSDKSQLRTRWNIQRDRADKLEVKLDNLQQAYNSLQEKHAKTIRQHASLMWQTTTRSLGRRASLEVLRSVRASSVPDSPLRLELGKAKLANLGRQAQPKEEDKEEEEEEEEEPKEGEGEKISVPLNAPKEGNDANFTETKAVETSHESKNVEVTEEEKEKGNAPISEEIVVEREARRLSDAELSALDQRDEEIYAQKEEEREKRILDSVAEINEEPLKDELGDEAFEIDEAPEMANYDQEIQKILSEKKELYNERNQLSSQRDELLSQVEELNCEKTNLSEKLQVNQTELASLKEEVKKLKQKVEEGQEKTSRGPNEKRYTRLEMAKILEQRDYYKTRYLDLEERFKSEEVPLLGAGGGNRPKEESSGVRGFFQSLFGPKKKSLSENRTDYEAMDSVDPELYSFLRSNGQGNTAATDTDDGCVQAYGWSLPGREFRSGSIALDTNAPSGARRLPLPVSPWASFSQPIPSLADYGPLPMQELDSKVTCAIAINSCDWCNPSVEPVIVPEADAQVWICIFAMGKSHVVVLNGSNPSGDETERFSVANLPIQCGISVPAAATGKKAMTSKKCATVWLGTRNGCIYIYSTLGDHSQWINMLKVPSAPRHFLYQNNRVVVGLSTAAILVYSRQAGGKWEWDSAKTIQIGDDVDRPIGPMVRADADAVWVSVANRIYILDSKLSRIDRTFETYENADFQISHMVSMGDGVWVAFKPTSTLRLFHVRTLEHVQSLNLASRIYRLLGVPGQAARPSSLKISALLLAHSALWAGTSTGIILSVPLTLDQQRQLHLLERAGDLRAPILASRLPCCFERDVRVFLHGHTLGVADLVVTPSTMKSLDAYSRSDGGGGSGGGGDDEYVFVDTKETIVISVGEGFTDFRAKNGTLASGTNSAVGGGGGVDFSPLSPGSPSNRVHMYAWLISTKSVSQ